MLDEQSFRRVSEIALDSLMQHLIVREAADADFEVEEEGGAMSVAFEQPAGKFVITPNSPMRQIWISALSTSFKLDWDETAEAFVLPRTGESFLPLVDRLIGEHLAS
jgi:CyaY protein